MHLVVRFLLLSIFATMLFAQKIEVTADSVEASGTKKEVQFNGNVHIWQDEHNWMRANQATIFFDDSNRTRLYEAKGNATFEIQDPKGHYKGNAQVFKHWPLESRYLMEGNAIVDDIINKRHLVGDIISVDMRSGNASIKSNTKKPVKLIFQLNQKSRKSK
ncbi:MAG: LptA/OstA family protein [Sulfurovaceae bacterium]|nr:LptA/OstA family protein [Sulfurovaceae bacterium]